MKVSALGSYPRIGEGAEKQKLRRAIQSFQAGKIPEEELKAIQDDVTREVLHEQEKAGLDWVTDDLKIAETGEYLLFIGCLPYYDDYFDDIQLESLNIAKSAIKILNKMGITPAVSVDERCCGHDIRWSGDTDMFKMLAQRNAEVIAKTGATKILATCAECYRTLKLDYPEFVEFDYEIQHMSQFIAENAEEIIKKILG